MKTIVLGRVVGGFAEDKDAAAKLRREVILPALTAGDSIEIDFGGVSLTTQSFIHALISEALRQHGEEALGRIYFRNCATAPRGIIETVVQYVLEARNEPSAQDADAGPESDASTGP
jgi:hypothetical protein